MVVIHLFLMLCDLQRVVRDLCPTLYTGLKNGKMKRKKRNILKQQREEKIKHKM
jgi:hypothetical protein